MCNACGFYCCASDVFSGCGCDHCDCPECWTDDDEFFGDDESFDDEIGDHRAPASASHGTGSNDAQPRSPTLSKD